MSPVPRAEVSEVLPALQQEIARLAGLPEIRHAFAWLRLQEAQFAAWQLEMARIAAPHFFYPALEGSYPLQSRARRRRLGHYCRGSAGQPSLRSYRARAWRTLLERLRRAESDCGSGARNSELCANAGARFSQDYVQYLRHPRWNFSKFHTGIGQHARGHPLDVDG